MARIRTVKPEMFQDEDLAAISEPAFILAIGLLNHADDEGYFKAHPGLIRATVFPLREPSVNIQGMLTELSNIGYIRFFTGSDGKQYGHVINFIKHQRINRPTPSKIKVLEVFTEDSRRTHGGLTPGKEQGTGNREQGNKDIGTPRKRAEPTEDFDHAWSAYPKRSGANSKTEAFKAWKARIKAGADPQDMIAGVERYRRWCEITGKIGTEYVKQGVTFFGPAEHYLETWEAPVDEARKPNDSRAKRVSDKLDQIIRDSLAESGQALDGGDLQEATGPLWTQVVSGHRRN